MAARLLVNAVLLGCAAALGVWLYGSLQERGGDRLSALDAAAVQRIDIERRGEQVVVLTKSSAGWRIRAPHDLPASEHHIDLLLRFLSLAVEARYPRREVDLAGAGLAEPTFAVRFDDQRYAFGGLDPLGRRRYLLHVQEVLLVREGVSALLASPWWNFIDRRLLPDGQPASLQFPDGRRVVLDREPALRADWQHASASIVRPLRTGMRGRALVLELRSGERIHWQWIDGEQPLLLRPDLGLAYQVSAEQLHRLLGQR